MLNFVKTNRIIAIVLLALFCGTYVYLEKNYAEDVAHFPQMILCVLGLLTVALIVILMLDKSEAVIEFPHWKPILVASVLAVLYTVLINVIGFYVSTGLYFVGSLLYFKERSVKKIALLTIGMYIAIYVLFDLFLTVPFPRGLLF